MKTKQAQQGKTEKAEKTDLWNYVERNRPQIEAALREHTPQAPAKIKTDFNEAIEYALFSGGKRLRPVLTLLGAELVGGDAETVLHAAAAVEFVHTSSLIFDDLPCMDNAGERRGKTSLHEKYGEGLAILVALGLLNAAYGLIFVNQTNSPELIIQAHAELVECVGASGMVGGQSVDLALAKGVNFNESFAGDFDFELVRNLKTSALTRLALRVGAILAGANLVQLNHLLNFATLLGDAYQIGDDLIDLEEDALIFDAEKTFAINQGQDAARLKLKEITAEAKQILIEHFPPNEARNCLIQMTDYLAERKS